MPPNRATPPTDKDRPRCGQCERKLVHPDDLPDLESSEDKWIFRGDPTDEIRRCCDCVIERDWYRPTYVAEAYAVFVAWKLQEEERLLQRWNDSVAALKARRSA